MTTTPTQRHLMRCIVADRDAWYTGDEWDGEIWPGYIPALRYDENVLRRLAKRGLVSYVGYGFQLEYSGALIVCPERCLP